MIRLFRIRGRGPGDVLSVGGSTGEVNREKSAPADAPLATAVRQLDIRRADLASVTVEEDDTARQWWLYALLMRVATPLCPANRTRLSDSGERYDGQA